MKVLIHYSAVLILLVFVSNVGFCQNSPAQDDYVNTSQEKQSFNKKKWIRLKKNIKQESKGQFHSENKKKEGSFYNYDKEDYDGKFSEYKNDDEKYDYESGNEGDNTGKGEGGGSNYYPKDNGKFGQQKYHPKDEIENYPTKRTQPTYEGGDWGWTKYLFYFILAVLIAFLLYQLFVKSTMDGTGKKINVIHEDMEPTEIPKSELELLLEKAIANSDFRGAIRIYFIFIVKDLSEKEWIRWEKKKTNFSYLIEMKNKPQYESFNEVVSIYELVWYGNYRVEKQDFNTLEPRFKQFLDSLNTAKKQQ